MKKRCSNKDFSNVKKRTQSNYCLSQPDLTPFIYEPTKESLKEILSDLKLIFPERQISHADLFQTLIHFWLLEVRKAPRLEVAGRLLKARRLAYRRHKLKNRKEEKDLNVLADRLISALD